MTDYLTILQNNTLLKLHITAYNRTLNGTSIIDGDMIHHHWIDDLQNNKERIISV